jgi:hypothetical protein
LTPGPRRLVIPKFWERNFKKAAASHAHAARNHKDYVSETVAKLFRATPNDKKTLLRQGGGFRDPRRMSHHLPRSSCDAGDVRAADYRCVCDSNIVVESEAPDRCAGLVGNYQSKVLFEPVAEWSRRTYPAPLGAGGVGSIPANSDAQRVPSFRRWRYVMKLSPFCSSKRVLKKREKLRCSRTGRIRARKSSSISSVRTFPLGHNILHSPGWMSDCGTLGGHPPGHNILVSRFTMHIHHDTFIFVISPLILTPLSFFPFVQAACSTSRRTTWRTASRPKITTKTCPSSSP